MANQAKPIVEIFWTGGFDSTFRVVQLSQKNISIRPVYIHAANGRQSESYELAAIVKIYRKLVLHPKTIANFLPIRIVGGVRFILKLMFLLNM